MQFEDFVSSKKRQQRIARIATSILVLVMITMGYRFWAFEKPTTDATGALARVLQMQGTAMIKRGSETVPYVPGFIVEAGDTIQTLAQSEMVVVYLDDDTRVTLSPHTTLLFNDSQGGKRTNLSGGQVELQVPQQPPDTPMVLASYNSEAIILAPGSYTQHYTGLATRFDVNQGKLRIRRFSDGRITEVIDGQSHECHPEDGGVIRFELEGLE